MEPALGTLAERLDILSRRHGVPTTIRLTNRERREYAIWLTQNDLENVR